jgi:hypothetical protein
MSSDIVFAFSTSFALAAAPSCAEADTVDNRKAAQPAANTSFHFMANPPK